MKTIARLALTGALGLLAACSDSGIDEPGFDDLAADFDSLTTEISARPLTDPLTLPTAGGATYDGVMGFTTDGGGNVPTEMAGDLSMSANFETDRISGSVGDVVTENDERLDGSLKITNGVIDRDADLAIEYTYNFDINGTLTDEDDRDLIVAGDGVGDFFGSDPTHVAGFVDGVVSSPTGNAAMTAGFVARD